MNPIENFYQKKKEFEFARDKSAAYIRKKHKNLFRLTDILIIVLVFSNFGALFITNALVFQDAHVNDYEIEIYEANPSMNNAAGITEPRSTNVSFIKLIFRQLLLLALLVGLYAKARMSISTMPQFSIFLGYWLFLVILLFMDFVNDLGFYVGKIVWGGL